MKTSNWHDTTIGKFISLQRGYDLTNSERTNGNFPVMGAAGRNGFHGEYKITGPGVIVGRSGGSYGKVHWAYENFWPHNTAMFVKDFKGNDPRFTYYFLKNIDFSSLNSGSAQPSLNRNYVYPIKIRIPSIFQQKQIAKVLSNLDAKIEVNDKINAELEAMAKLIYDYWFVQFDFPNVNGKPYKSSGGKMVYNKELKLEIPKGWDSSSMADWIKNDANGAWGQSEPSGNYTIKVNCIRGADFPSLDGFKPNISPIRFIHENKTHKILKSNDLIVEISGGSPTQSTGRISFVTEETFKRYEAPLICANFCKAVRLKNPKNLYNFYYIWKEAFEQGNMFNYEGKTSGIRNLLFSSLVESFKVPIPNPDLVEKFYEFMKPIQNQKQQNLLENQKLADLRDWLLPMLMNGQVTVKSEKRNELHELFPSIHLYAEVAALQLIDRRMNRYSHGKTFIQKSMSHLKDIRQEERLKNVDFEEYHWGMFSKTIAQAIDDNPYLLKEKTSNGKSVYNVKPSKLKELSEWMSKPENQGFVKSIESLISIYQEPLIDNDIDRIELLNTVYRCITKLETTDLDKIRQGMRNWPMQDGNHKNKAEKFTPNETMHMIQFIKTKLA